MKLSRKLVLLGLFIVSAFGVGFVQKPSDAFGPGNCIMPLYAPAWSLTGPPYVDGNHQTDVFYCEFACNADCAYSNPPTIAQEAAWINCESLCDCNPNLTDGNSNCWQVANTNIQACQRACNPPENTTCLNGCKTVQVCVADTQCGFGGTIPCNPPC